MKPGKHDPSFGMYRIRYSLSIAKCARPRGVATLEFKVPCGEFTLGAFRIVPIRDVEALEAEARAMQNCLREYGGICATEIMAVYSIRDVESAERIACFSVWEDPSKGAGECWTLEQVAGKRNARVSRQVEEMAKAAVRRINEVASR